MILLCFLFSYYPFTPYIHSFNHPCQNRTGDTSVKEKCLNHLTNGRNNRVKYTLCNGLLLSPLCTWCARWDSNPHIFRHKSLNLTCLTIPPLAHIIYREAEKLSIKTIQELNPNFHHHIADSFSLVFGLKPET